MSPEKEPDIREPDTVSTPYQHLQACTTNSYYPVSPLLASDPYQLPGSGQYTMYQPYQYPYYWPGYWYPQTQVSTPPFPTEKMNHLTVNPAKV